MNEITTDSRASADDLRAKVHELFAKTVGNLDPQLDKLIKSGCGIVADHDELGGYAAAKLFLKAFLCDEAEQWSIPNHCTDKIRYHRIANNYWRFL